MSNLYKIIEQIQKELTCPICAKHFGIGEIRVKGLFDHAIIIQTVCENSHVTIFMTRYQSQVQVEQPITNKEIFDLQQKFKKFDGDFHKIWSK